MKYQKIKLIGLLFNINNSIVSIAFSQTNIQIYITVKTLFAINIFTKSAMVSFQFIDIKTFKLINMPWRVDSFIMYNCTFKWFYNLLLHVNIIRPFNLTLICNQNWTEDEDWLTIVLLQSVRDTPECENLLSLMSMWYFVYLMSTWVSTFACTVNNNLII